MRTPTRLRSVLVWTLLLTGTALLQAQTYTNNYGVWSYAATSNAVAITQFRGSGSTVVAIPAAINGLPVTTIADEAFNNDYAYFTSAVIPNSVTSIGQNAFAWCTYMTNVLVGTGVTNISNNAFFVCTALQGIYFLGNAPAYGSYAFSDDSHAAAYYLPRNSGWTNSQFAGIPAMAWNPPLPPPAIATYSNRPVVFFPMPAAFPVSLGTNFVVQMTTNLASGNWVTVSNYVPLVSLQFTNSPSPAYFRIQ